jgi:hypothetical protein
MPHTTSNLSVSPVIADTIRQLREDLGGITNGEVIEFLIETALQEKQYANDKEQPLRATRVLEEQ